MHVWSRTPAIGSVIVPQQDKDKEISSAQEQKKCCEKTLGGKVQRGKNRPDISDL